MISKYITGLDKLELTCQSANNNPFVRIDLINIYEQIALPFYSENGFVLKKENVSSGNYNLCYKVCYNQLEFATLFTDFTFKNADINCVGLYLDNFNFYSQQETRQIIDLFLSTFDLEVRNVKAVDIFLDSRQNIRNLFKKHFYNPTKYHFLTNGNRPFVENPHCKKVITLNRNKAKETATATYYIGNLKKTGKQICIYNKTKEIELHSHKEYITNFHTASLPGTNDVYRYELRLTNSYLYKYSVKLDWRKCFDSDYQLTLVKDTQLDFRKNTNDRVNRCEKIDLFAFNSASLHTIKWQTDYPNRNSQKTRLTNEKVLLKLIEQAFITNNRKLFNEAKQLSRTLDLYDFFVSNSSDYPKEKATEINNSLW